MNQGAAPGHEPAPQAGAVAAVLLAAGESRRMGRPKLTMPWGEAGSVIGHVVGLFRQAGADPIVVVTGVGRRKVERALHQTGVVCVHNPGSRQGGMLSSIRVGLAHLQPAAAEAALLAPADIPYLSVDTVRAVLERRGQSGADLIVPSYRMRRGHPVLIGRDLWQEVLGLPEGKTLRDYLRRRAAQIEYVVVQDPGVIQDLDTPEDYEGGAPG